MNASAEHLPLGSVRKLHIEMGYPCNLRCIMCFQGNFQQRMDPRIWRTALLPIYRSVSRVHIQGGEPTILKDCRALIDLILSINPAVQFGVMTNGLRFDEYWRETFVQHGFDVNFSVNGASRQVHEGVNVGSDWDAVMRNFTELVRLRDERAPGLRIYASFVVIPENVHEIAEFIEMAHQLGVNVRFFHDLGRMPAKSPAVDDVVKRGLDLADAYRDRTSVVGLAIFYRDYCKRWGIENRFGCQQDSVPPKCRVPWQELNVDRLGIVKTCCMSSLILGDLNKTGIEEIWNGSRARQFRRRIAAGDFRHCQVECALNTKPNFGVDYAKTSYYFWKFLVEFRRSPRLAYRKALRKIKQIA